MPKDTVRRVAIAIVEFTITVRQEYPADSHLGRHLEHTHHQDKCGAQYTRFERNWAHTHRHGKEPDVQTSSQGCLSH